MKTILIADIGGTHSRFVHFRTDSETPLDLVDAIWLPTPAADSFEQLLEQLRSSGFSLPTERADIAVIAVAGPVEQAS